MRRILAKSKIVLFLACAGLMACDQRNSDGSSEAGLPTNCAVQLQQLYAQYRTENQETFKAMREFDKKQVVLPRRGKRQLFVYPINFKPDSKILHCAASEGDQLANYMVAVIPTEPTDNKTESATAGRLRHLRRAALSKVGAPDKCIDIDLVDTPECSSGLPEAHLLLADASSEQGNNCDSERIHYRIAVSQGALSAWAIPSGCR